MQKREERPSFQEVINLITPIMIDGQRRYLVRGHAGCYFMKPQYAQKAARELLSKKHK
jgi:hypothetical protein